MSMNTAVVKVIYKKSKDYSVLSGKNWKDVDSQHY